MRNTDFNLVEEREMAEVGGKARLWRHKATGAELLSIANADENKCFGVNFYTPPTDSTGVAHILEHSVLCGSKKYPVKEPFVELLKGSLQTFLNAFTFPDKTCYPVASANLRDFYNLIDVYLDAVFHPLLSEDTFRQEGWHVEAESAAAPWIFKGVVYNEMKGVYSSPDSVIGERSQQAIFPDNLYSLDSGGNPEKIPDLTYQAFSDFHARYYQPANARFFFWGDDPEEKRLEIVARAVKGYGPMRAPEPVPLQKPFAKPVYIEAPYAAAEGEERSLFTTSWLLGERGDVDLALKMEMLEHILEGLPGSPLRRALIDSGLGEDSIGCGLETDLRQMYYSTGLKGVQPADIGRAEEIVLSTLSKLAEKGIEPLAIEAAVNSVEFAYRENNSGRFPRGLAAMIQALSTWLYGGDPLAPLAWEKPLAKIKADLAKGEKIFEKAIKDFFLDNPSRARVSLLPDRKLSALKAESEKGRLDTMREQASSLDRQEVVEETRRLKKAQLAQDALEDLAKIPSLGIRDLPKENSSIPCAIKDGPQTFISHELPTRGVAYVNLLLPMEKLPERLIPLLPLFSRSLADFGTAGKDFSELGMLVAAKTGGIGAAPLTGMKHGGSEAFCYLSLTGKSVYGKISDMFSLFREMLLDPLEDREKMAQRLGQMVLEDKARLEYGLQAAGHGAIGTRLRAHYTPAGALGEKMSGISQLYWLREFSERLHEDPDAILDELEELRSIVIGAQGAIFDCVAEGSAIVDIEKEAAALLRLLPAGKTLAEGDVLATYAPMGGLPAGEAFLTPGMVNYVGKAANLYRLGYQYHGSANVILRWLRMGRLWETVRVAGGAYGAFCIMDRLGGTLVCTSYRDPNVDGTIAAYDDLARFARENAPSPQQLEQAIVGAVGDLDAYLLPDAKGAKSLAWHLSGQTPEMLQKMREEMLSTTVKDFHSFADVLAAFAREGDICVLGGAGAEAAAKDHGWAMRQLL